MTQHDLWVHAISVIPEQVQAFDRDGAIVLRGLFTDRAIAALGEPTTRGLIRRGRLLDSHHHLDLSCPPVEGICRSAAFQSVVERLCGGPPVFVHGGAFVQQPGDPGVRWHFDVYSFNFLRPEDRAWSMWIPLTPIRPRSGSGGMEYVRRSDRSAAAHYETMKEVCAMPLTQRKHIETLRERFGGEAHYRKLEECAVAPDLDLGDALFFAKDLWHRSVPSADDASARRVACSLRFIDRDARLDRTLLEGIQRNGFHEDEGPTTFSASLEALAEGDLLRDYLGSAAGDQSE
jgi:ectoine hydroxylase-related dioxygenase (phytanoyl-CoA dioxygenase family)